MCSKTTNYPRQCVICNRRLIGRSDKVFCDIRCKNYYHAEIRKSARTVVRETVSILKNNYIIITGLMGADADKMTIDRLPLEKSGFNFNHITGVRLDSAIPIYYVFEYAFSLLENNRVEFHVDTGREVFSPFVFRRWARKFTETKIPISA